MPNRQQGAVRGPEQDYGAAPVECRPEATVAELFVRATVRCPESTALLGSEGSLSYGELLLRAQNVAVRLRRLGVRAGDVVGIVEHHSFQTFAGVLGILLAGAVYLPFARSALADLPSAPANRAALLQRIEAYRITTMLIDGAADKDQDTPGLPTVRWVDLAEIDREKMPLHAESALPDVDPESAAVLVEERGGGLTAVTHRAIAHIASSPQLFALRGAQTLLLTTPMAERMHVMELWGALLGGSTLALPPDTPISSPSLTRLLRQYRVTSLMLHSSTFVASAALTPEAFGTLQQLAIYGESSAAERSGADPLAADPIAADPIREKLDSILVISPNLRVLYSRRAMDSNSYIPVELAAQVAHDEITPAEPEPVLPQPPSVPALPMLEPAASATEPDGAGAPGMTDRAETVEQVLREHPLVAQCAVVPGGGGATAPLCVFIMLSTEQATELVELSAAARARVAAEQLWAHLRERLPEEARPARIVVRPQLPLNAEGQPDRALLETEVWNELRERRGPGRVDRSTYQAYAEQVRAIWVDLLHRTDISPDDDFYAAGGSEIDMIRLHAEMNRRFPGAITMADLPVLRTLRTLMNHLLGQVARDRTAALEQRRAS